MKKEELIENYLVYTDNGIEKVHWCNVNGVKELVSPKGKVYGYVPDYFEVKRLQEQIKEANGVIADLSEYPPINISTRELSSALNRYNAKNYLDKWGVK